MKEIKSILDTHDDLDDVIRDPKGRIFVSEWNCRNPYSDEYLSGIDHQKIPPDREVEYFYFKDDDYLTSLVKSFHHSIGEAAICKENIVAGAGSTPLLAAFCMWMKKNNINEYFYVPPLYYTFYYYSDILGLKPRPVCGKHAFEKNISLNLPPQKSVLVLCDPIWYAGISMTEEVIHKIREWQKKTGSVVFVDGSFQYTKWNQPHFEHTASLDHDLTFRVVCPTKALAIHGYRFSYAIVPETERELFTYLYENMCGSTPLRNLLFAQQAMTVLGSNTSNKKILNEIEMSFNLLMKRGAITPVGTPDCGYFIFAKLKESMRNIIAMDESYFELSGYPEYVRVNLIAPNILDAFS